VGGLFGTFSGGIFVIFLLEVDLMWDFFREKKVHVGFGGVDFWRIDFSSGILLDI